MLLIKKYIFYIVISCSLLVVLADTVLAKDVSVYFAELGSVAVIQAKIIETPNQELRITGQLKRPHRIPMTGHLHTYIYSDKGDLLADSKHRVLGLNSKRKGMMRVSFNILVEAVPTDASKAFLEYHDPGHKEC